MDKISKAATFETIVVNFKTLWRFEDTTITKKSCVYVWQDSKFVEKKRKTVATALIKH